MIIGVGDCRRTWCLVKNLLVSSSLTLSSVMAQRCTGKFFTSVPPLTVLYLDLALFISSLPVPNHNASRGHGNTQLMVIKSHFFYWLLTKSLSVIEIREVPICTCKINKQARTVCLSTALGESQQQAAGQSRKHGGFSVAILTSETQPSVHQGRDR